MTAENNRKRIRRILPGIDQPLDLDTIAEIVDCSTEEIRPVLQEYEELGVVVKINESPERYKKNPQYYQFLRSHKLAENHGPTELREQLQEKKEKHQEFRKKFGVKSPDEVDVSERESKDEYKEYVEWKGTIAKINDIEKALDQLD